MKPKVVLLDMDGTLILDADSLLFLCDIRGIDPQLLDHLNASYAADEMTWIDGDYTLVRQLAGMRIENLEQEFDNRLQVIDGLSELLQALKKRGYISVLLSGGAACVVEIMMERYPFDYGIGSIYEIKNNAFTGEIIDHVGDAGKVERAKKLCKQIGADFQDCVAVGDGISDLYLFEELENTIAINACVELQEIASYTIHTGNILDLEPIIQGMLSTKVTI